MTTGPARALLRRLGQYPAWLQRVLQSAAAAGRGEPGPTLPVVRGWVREIMGLLYVIDNRRLLSMLDSFRRNAPLRR